MSYCHHMIFWRIYALLPLGVLTPTVSLTTPLAQPTCMLPIPASLYFLFLCPDNTVIRVSSTLGPGEMFFSSYSVQHTVCGCVQSPVNKILVLTLKSS